MNTPADSSQNLEALLEIPLELSVELASCRKSTADILSLDLGSVVEFEGSANDPVELYVNQKLVASGEIIVTDDHLGIRITEVVGQKN